MRSGGIALMLCEAIDSSRELFIKLHHQTIISSNFYDDGGHCDAVDVALTFDYKPSTRHCLIDCEESCYHPQGNGTESRMDIVYLGCN